MFYIVAVIIGFILGVLSSWENIDILYNSLIILVPIFLISIIYDNANPPMAKQTIENLQEYLKITKAKNKTDDN